MALVGTGPTLTEMTTYASSSSSTSSYKGGVSREDDTLAYPSRDSGVGVHGENELLPLKAKKNDEPTAEETRRDVWARKKEDGQQVDDEDKAATVTAAVEGSPAKVIPSVCERQHNKEEENDDGDDGEEEDDDSFYLPQKEPLFAPLRSRSTPATTAPPRTIMRQVQSLPPQRVAGPLRHEALEELAGNVRDLRAEVHGRPSLCERRFTSLRRSRSCGSLKAALGMNDGMREVLEEAMAEAEEAEEMQGKGAPWGAERAGRKSSEKRLSSSSGSGNAGGILRRRKSKLSASRALRRRSHDMMQAMNRSVNFAEDILDDVSFTSSSASSRKSSLRWSGRSETSKQLAEEIHNDLQRELGPDGDDFISPRMAAMGAVESVYSLVSALYGLSDSHSVDRRDSAAVLDHTPRIDVAFRRIKPVLSKLVFESDYDDSAQSRSYEACIDDDECSFDIEELEQRRMLVRRIRSVSRLVDAAAETVRRLTDGSDDSQKQPAGEGESIWTPTLECCYVTLVELIGAECADVKRINKEMSALNGVTAIPGYDFNASMQSACFSEASGTVFGMESMMNLAYSMNSAKTGGEDRDKPPVTRWKLSLALRRTWSKSAQRALEVLVGSEGAGATGGLLPSMDVSSIVDLDLFYEVATLVLRTLEWCPKSYLEFVTASSSRSEDEGEKLIARDGDTIEGAFLRRKKEWREKLVKIEQDFDDPEREMAAEDLQDSSTLRDAEILVGLGKMKSSIREYESALAHFMEGLRIRRFHYGNDDPRVAAVHEAIGNMHRAMGRFNEAGTSYDRALRSRRNSASECEDNQMATISLLKSWTSLKEKTGDIDEAIDTLSCCLNLQMTKLEQQQCGNASAARDCITFSQVADTLQRRGSLCMENDRVDAALADFTEVLRIRIQEEGPDAPSAGDAMHTLGLLRFLKREFEAALGHMWEALRVRKVLADEEEKCGNGSWEARMLKADTLVIIGMILHELGKPEVGIQFLDECLELRTESMGMLDEKVADVHAALERAHRDLDHFEDASKHCIGALNIIEMIHGASDMRVPKLLLSIGMLEFKCKNYAKAKTYLEKFVLYQKERDEIENTEYVSALLMLGKAMHKTGDKDAARETLAEAQMIYATTQPTSRSNSVGKDLLATLREMNMCDGDEKSVSSNESSSTTQSKKMIANGDRASPEPLGGDGFLANVRGLFSESKKVGASLRLELENGGIGVNTKEECGVKDQTGRKKSRASMSAMMLSSTLGSNGPVLAMDHIWDDMNESREFGEDDDLEDAGHFGDSTEDDLLDNLPVDKDRTEVGEAISSSFLAKEPLTRTNAATKSFPSPPPKLGTSQSLGARPQLLGFASSFRQEALSSKSNERRGFWGAPRRADEPKRRDISRQGGGRRAQSMGFWTEPKQEQPSGVVNGHDSDGNWLSSFTRKLSM